MAMSLFAFVGNGFAKATLSILKAFEADGRQGMKLQRDNVLGGSATDESATI